MIRNRGERPVDPRTDTPPVPVKPKYAAAINWWKLDERERRDAFEILLVWVPELVRRYGLSDQVIPRCWWQHEALIQELLALYQYRNQMQFLPVAAPPAPAPSPPNAPLDFHVQLNLAEGRLRRWTGELGCNSREHMPTRVPAWADPTNSAHAEWLAEVRSASTSERWIRDENLAGMLAAQEQSLVSRVGGER